MKIFWKIEKFYFIGGGERNSSIMVNPTYIQFEKPNGAMEDLDNFAVKSYPGSLGLTRAWVFGLGKTWKILKNQKIGARDWLILNPYY